MAAPIATMPKLCTAPVAATPKVAIGLFVGDVERLDRWAHETGATRTGAIRSLIRSGLDRLEREGQLAPAREGL